MKNTIKTFVSRFIRNVFSETFPIVKNPRDYFEVVATVKRDSWENTYYAECYGHNKEQQLEVFSPEDIIIRVKNGIVIEGSDILFTDLGAYWGKYNQDEFYTYLKPLDDNVIWYDRDSVRVDKYRKVEFVPGRVIPLIGHDAHHWVHSIYEFLPRLFSAGEAGLLQDPVTILVIENLDRTILEIINSYLRSFPTAIIKKAKNKVAYRCEDLYFQPVVGPSCSDYKFRLDYPWYIPRYIIEQTFKYVVTPVVERVKNNKCQHDKIFLGRSAKYASNRRILINYDEVHDYFISKGFVDVEGGALTLVEKANIFYHAKEIVALHGAAIMNLMFCNQAKCMVMGNYRFATDAIGYAFFRDKVASYVYVTGQDDSSEYHSSYYIPLEKIKKVYEERVAG